MKLLYEWVIPSSAFLIWILLVLIIIPVLMRFLKKKAEQTQHTFDEILVSASTGRHCDSIPNTNGIYEK